ncbi:vacuolar ATPase assembly integral membrane protein vma21 [Friedmanniomyces endolithicus]|uniref:Vacuolar ATPase assembly integral membrane protein vma21 n=1 Tax=Friedmanniomyces endolithicus TaxID=329885 RepID=A0AAN6FSB7_9PEZI|nr:vacuolar ATPase assembly integral membrane protein vma21 [Friedmanniomyces endolithicus]KAK0321411.1 vacuolar ATPase assembly integral membrane protein vma21 [Friedmanniomyces endolithicus]KAK0985423.1 vacuolar ATPase assembly integral membrane protein vma21 [Friedmanniomyces endolithicus]
MAQRRPVAQEKSLLDQDETKGTPSDVTPAVAPATIAKLLFFTFAMITFPISSYFLTVHNLFSGNTTYAGALAAFVANVVLMGYVIVAFQDDKSEREIDAAAAANEKKKSR